MQMQTQIRAYLRPVPGLPLAVQRRMAEHVGAAVVYVYQESGRAHDDRDAWMRSLRPGDTAWLARLDVLAMPKADLKARRVSVDFATALGNVLSRGAILVDGTTGDRSDAGSRWAKRVEWAMLYLGRVRLTPAKARKQGRKGAAVLKARSVSALWLSDVMRAERERWASVWRDAAYTSDEDAAAAIDVDDLRGRPALCRRVFGRRRPRAKWSGGRPRKATTE